MSSGSPDARTTCDRPVWFADWPSRRVVFDQSASLLTAERQIRRNCVGVRSRAHAVFREPPPVVRQPRRTRVGEHTLARLAHEVAERGERHELPRREQIAVRVSPYVGRGELSAGCSAGSLSGAPCRLAQSRRCAPAPRFGEQYTRCRCPSATIAMSCAPMRRPSPSALMCVSPATSPHARQRKFAPRRRPSALRPTSPAPGPHLEPNHRRLLRAVHHRLDPRLLPLLRRERERPHERHPRAARRVGARHRARPQPRDHRRLAAALRRRQPHLRVQVPDAPLRLVAHPPAVVPNVVGQPRRALPHPAVRERALRAPGSPAAARRTSAGSRSAPW